MLQLNLKKKINPINVCVINQPGPDVEQYMQYMGGAAGMLALTGVGVGVAAASAYYLASRPTPTLPPFDLDNQTIIEVN